MTAGQPSPVGAWLDLETVLRHLHESGIRVGIQTFDAGILVWISDRWQRDRLERVFKHSGANPTWIEDSAALWLHASALKLFPSSPYARTTRLSGGRPTTVAATR
jgi:hypothetical protein